jgi:hypothetical protein
MITKAEGDNITMVVNPEYKKAQKEIDDFRNREEKKPVDVEMKPETKALDKEVEEVKKPVTKDVEFEPQTKKIDDAKKKAESKITTKVYFDPDTSAADAARTRISQPIIVPVTYVATNSPPSGAGAGSAGSQRMSVNAGPTTLASRYNAAPMKMTVPTDAGEVKVDVYFNIDGKKLKAAMERNTISNLEDYLIRENAL